MVHRCLGVTRSAADEADARGVEVLLKRISMVVVVLSAAAALLALPPAASASSGKKKCAGFASQKAAQKYFVGHGGSSSKDVGGLDPDGDGLVCPDNPGPFAAYVELNFAKGFFYGTVVCVNYPAHRSKGEVRAEERAREEAEKKGEAKFASGNCSAAVIEVELKKVAPGPDPVVASHKAEAAANPISLPLGAPEKKKAGDVFSFEFKLVPKGRKGTFYAVSENCYGTASRRLTP